MNMHFPPALKFSDASVQQQADKMREEALEVTRAAMLQGTMLEDLDALADETWDHIAAGETMIYKLIGMGVDVEASRERVYKKNCDRGYYDRDVADCFGDEDDPRGGDR